jgi:hypothetical protein
LIAIVFPFSWDRCHPSSASFGSCRSTRAESMVVGEDICAMYRFCVFGDAALFQPDQMKYSCPFWYCDDVSRNARKHV